MRTDVETNHVNLTGLHPYYYYDVWVVAYNGIGASPNSEIKRVRTLTAGNFGEFKMVNSEGMAEGSCPLHLNSTGANSYKLPKPGQDCHSIILLRGGP